MPRTVIRTWTFPDAEWSSTTYETRLYDDMSMSCSCGGISPLEDLLADRKRARTIGPFTIHCMHMQWVDDGLCNAKSIMPKSISKCWTFASSSGNGRTYQTLL